MDDADLETVLTGLIELARKQGDLIEDVADMAKVHRRRLGELEATLDEAMAALMRVPASVRLLLNMKAATLTMTCAKCGAEYAQEAGPELCGPCWIEAGKPGTIGLHVV